MPPLRSDSEFRKLWLGQAVSEVGSWVSGTALPLTAVVLVGATPAQMGVLSAVGSGSALVIGLFAGVLADGALRRPILIWSDIARALVLATIPAAALLHLLTYTQVLAVAATVGAVTVFFDVAYQSYLPSLIPEEQLFAGNRFLGMSTAAAEVVGPFLAGALIQIVSAPVTIMLDAASFLVSAGSVASIRRPEHVRVRAPRMEILAGARVIRAHPLLSALALRAITSHFAWGMMAALYVLYAIGTLRMTTLALGLTIALGGAGSLAGAHFSERISIRLGTARVFFLSALATGVLNLLIPLSTLWPSLALLLLGTAQLVGDAAWTVYITNEMTLRQRVVPADVLGRVNAAMQTASQGMLPLGALAGGFLAARFGIPAALWTSAVVFLGSCLWLLMAQHAGSEFAALNERN